MGNLFCSQSSGAARPLARKSRSPEEAHSEAPARRPLPHPRPGWSLGWMSYPVGGNGRAQIRRRWREAKGNFGESKCEEKEKFGSGLC